MRTIKLHERGDTVTIDLDENGLKGQQAEVLEVSPYKFGVDLRVRTDDGEEFWISADNVI